MIQIDDETLQDIINIELKLFYPLDGFMDSKDYGNVVNNLRLSNGKVWTIPITLDVDTFKGFNDEEMLVYKNKVVAKIEIEDIYKIKEEDILKIYKTLDINHPGVKKELQRGKYRAGGKVKVIDSSILENQLNPKKVKKFFIEKGWNSVVGFQTRNIPHRAHEYLHRLGLEFCDALFINPIVGWKKRGDFNEKAVIDGYKALIDNYYTNLNVYFNTLKTPMRYAGPKEAIFHAIIRKNLGCSHFIIGRDHAGVGDYYGKYEAHELVKQLQKDLDIQILLFKEPFYCNVCKQIVSENCCGHKHEYTVAISGTKIRKILSNGEIPPEEFIRREVADAVIKLGNEIFIKE